MKAFRISPEEYATLFPTPSHLYNSVEFNLLNAPKCDDVHFVALRDDRAKTRFGVILGRRGTMLRSPFSAPFGGLEVISKQHAGQYVEAINALRAYGLERDLTIRLTLPPMTRPCSHLTKTIGAVCATGGRMEYMDYNFHYPLSLFPTYESDLGATPRYDLNKARRSGFVFAKVDPADSAAVQEVYDIISANHSALGYPVHMSLQDLKETSRLIPVDYFILTSEGRGVASAIVYRAMHGVAQLIYWGDLPDYRAMRPMSLLAYSLVEYYHNADLELFDLGPASSDGIPALGLCDFKERLGCVATPKVSLIL